MNTFSRLPALLALLAGLALSCPSAALAHGAPSLTVKEQVSSPGGTITLSGDTLGNDGDTVTLTLRGMSYQGQLGTAKLTDDLFDNQVFTLPKDVPAGTYSIAAKNGSVTASAQIELTAAPAAQAAPSAPAMASTAGQAGASALAEAQPSDAAASLPISRSPLEWFVEVGLVAATSALAVLLLWRSRSGLTAIDV